MLKKFWFVLSCILILSSMTIAQNKPYDRLVREMLMARGSSYDTPEANFFRVLKRVVGERGHVLAQVSLRQLLWFPGNSQSNPRRGAWQNKVARICLRQNLIQYATNQSLMHQCGIRGRIEDACNPPGPRIIFPSSGQGAETYSWGANAVPADRAIEPL